MNTKQLLLTLIAAAAMAAAAPSFAGRYHDDEYRRGDRHRETVPDKASRKSDRRYAHYLDRRQTRQLRRIEEGIESGELTGKEARKLTRQQRRIARAEREFSEDGHYSRKERRILEARLDKASDAIYRKKHNDRIRRQRYSEGLWKPRHGAASRQDGDLHLGIFLYPGQGFPFWW